MRALTPFLLISVLACEIGGAGDVDLTDLTGPSAPTVGSFRIDVPWVCVEMPPPDPVACEPWDTLAVGASLELDADAPLIGVTCETRVTCGPQSVGCRVDWTSSDSNVIAVSSTGRNTARVEGVSIGVATITAKGECGGLGTQVDSIEVRVIP